MILILNIFSIVCLWTGGFLIGRGTALKGIERKIKAIFASHYKEEIAVAMKEVLNLFSND